MMPSQTPDLPSPAERDRRQHPRFDLLAPVTLLLARTGARTATATANLKDISEGGCFLSTSLSVEAGRRVSVAFLAQPRTPCWAQGSVVRAVDGQGFGVRFDDANEPFRRMLGTLATTPDRKAELAELLGAAELLIS